MNDNHLKDWLQGQGMTQVELAELLGYNYEAVNRVANGARPTAAFMWKFFVKFGQAGLVAAFDGTPTPPIMRQDRRTHTVKRSEVEE